MYFLSLNERILGNLNRQTQTPWPLVYLNGIFWIIINVSTVEDIAMTKKKVYELGHTFANCSMSTI